MAENEMDVKKIGKFLPIVLAVSVFFNIALAMMYLRTKSEYLAFRSNPQAAVETETKALVAEISKLITLPEGTPILATVNDPNKLKDRQPFFANAEAGDKLLMYTNVADPNQRKAFLFRPSTKQLLNVAPITLSGSIQPQEDAFKAEVRNGSPIAGVEDRMQELLSRVFPKATVAAKGKATHANYLKSVLVKVNASEELTKKVANLFNVDVVSLPAGESKPADVDLLFIIGGGEATGSGVNK